MSYSAHKQDAMVAVAGIAADLSSVMHIAWEVTLASKNAMFIAAQAGEKARGFQPITGFIDEIASATTSGVTKINVEALEVSRLAVEEIRARDAMRRFSEIYAQASDARHLASLDTAIAQLRRHIEDLNQNFRTRNRSLSDLLENLDDGMRAASAIAAVCRIEASRAAEFRTNLTVVADNLDNAASQIKEMITHSRKRLNSLSVKEVAA
ncbi:MAG: hypothetical protein KDI36_10435 [Pseudomonadales bacterium]|nr:hypothetical protein [Pseudomonadales bacterium]